MFLKGGPADDALAVSGGINLPDGGQGSNSSSAGNGADGGFDTFLVDGRGGGITWSAWSISTPATKPPSSASSAGQTMAVTASDGVAGYEGVTIHSELAGASTGVNASFTFADIGADTLARHLASAPTCCRATSLLADHLRMSARASHASQHEAGGVLVGRVDSNPRS